MAERDSSSSRVSPKPDDSTQRRAGSDSERKNPDEHTHRLRGDEFDRDFYDAERDGSTGAGRDDLISDS